MEKETVTTIEDLTYYKKNERKSVYKYLKEQIFENLIIDFELNIYDFEKSKLGFNTQTKNNILKFINCEFKHTVYFPFLVDYNIEFENNCIFTRVKASQFRNNITFRDSIIKKLDFENATFGSEEEKNDKKGKVKFHNCNLYDTNFRNTTFNSLADFWSSTFHKPVTFYKTDFRGIAVFSSVTFKENVLFTYTLIEKLLILRGTWPEKGFDISLAIIAGELSIFDFLFEDYKAYSKIYEDLDKEYKKYNYNISHQEAYETVYEKAVSQNHQIPLENKRETYRILKNQLISQKNFIDAVPFRVMENKTLLKESVKKLLNGHTITRPLSNIIVLFLNAISNWFGSSYIMGVLFTVSIGALFFNLALSHIGDFTFTWNYEDWQWKYFVQFINPTHRFDFMKSVDSNPKNWFYIWDFLGRIFIGYGIYQTITAFRKYK